MSQPLQSAADFFKKHHLGPRDSVDTKKIEEFLNDYKALSPQNEYAVFVRLEKGGEWEVLKKLNSSWTATPDRNGVCSFENQASDLIKKLRENLSTPKMTQDGIWTKRLAVKEGLFALGQLYYYGKLFGTTSYATDSAPSVPWNIIGVEELSHAIHDSLTGLYDQSWDRASFPRGNPYFDTDHDFDPYESTQRWESAFDDRDVLPLNPDHHMDTDQDGIADELDLDPNDGSVWTDLQPGQTKKIDSYLSITRKNHSDFEIAVRLPLGADPWGDTKLIANKYLNKHFLSELGLRLQTAFSKATRSGPHTLSLSIHLYQAGKDARISLTNKRVRGHMELWGYEILHGKKGAIALHETAHFLFGSRDLYFEPLVESGQRDFTLSPGYEILASHDLMRNHAVADPVLPQAEIMNWIAGHLNGKKESAYSKPWDPDLLVLLGDSLVKQKKNTEAVDLYYAALGHHPTSWSLHLGFIESLVKCNRLEEAKRDVHRLLNEIYPYLQSRDLLPIKRAAFAEMVLDRLSLRTVSSSHDVRELKLMIHAFRKSPPRLKYQGCKPHLLDVELKCVKEDSSI